MSTSERIGVDARLRARLRAPTHRTVLGAAMVVFTLIGGSWAIASPLFSVPDEPAHVIRAAAVATGELIGDQVEVTFTDPRPGSAIMHVVEVPRPFDEAGGQHVCFAATAATADCATPLAPSEGVASATTTAGAYQPVFYGVVGLPIRVLSPVQALYAGRLLLDHGRPRDAVLAVASAFALAWARPLSPLIAAGIVAVGMMLVARRELLAELRRSRSRQLAVGGIVLAIVSGAVWVQLSGALDSFIAYPDPSLTGWMATVASWGQSWTRLEQLVGYIGWLDTPLPDPLWWIWLGLMVLAGVVAVAVGPWRARIVVIAMMAAALLVPVIAETLTASRMGLVWQGRYTLPIAVGAVLVPAHVIGRHLRPGRAASWTAVGIAAACGMGHVWAHMVSMTRYSVGYTEPSWSYLANPGWSAPVPDVPLLGVVLVGAAGLVALVAWAGASDVSPDDAVTADT